MRPIPRLRPLTGVIALIIIFALLIAGGALLGDKDSTLGLDESMVAGEYRYINIKTPKGTILAMVADTPEKRTRGLSYRGNLGQDEGMLFIFDQPGMNGFWMKDMNFALDMIWLAGSSTINASPKTVIGVTRNATPESYPKAFMPPVPVIFVLELNSGASEKFGLATGTQIMF